MFFIFGVVLALGMDRIFYVGTEWWLASWTSAEDESINRLGHTFEAQSSGKSAQYQFLKCYAIILLLSLIGTALRTQWIIQGGARCSEKMFAGLFIQKFSIFFEE